MQESLAHSPNCLLGLPPTWFEHRADLLICTDFARFWNCGLWLQSYIKVFGHRSSTVIGKLYWPHKSLVVDGLKSNIFKIVSKALIEPYVVPPENPTLEIWYCIQNGSLAESQILTTHRSQDFLPIGEPAHGTQQGRPWTCWSCARPRVEDTSCGSSLGPTPP